VLAIAGKDKTFHRDYFTRGSMVDMLKEKGLGNYWRVGKCRIDYTLE